MKEINKGLKIFAIIIPSLLISSFSLIFSEIFLLTLYKVTGSRYFETQTESFDRLSLKHGESGKNFVEELESERKKIAFFGGSSAAGYAVTTTTEKVLNDTFKDKIVIHNYAEAGAPFNNNQSNIVDYVQKYYDVIFVYAGHNDLWSHIYGTIRRENRDFKFPGGKVVTPLEARKRTISNNYKLNAIKGKIEGAEQLSFGKYLVNNLRTPNLLFRFTNKLITALYPKKEVSLKESKFPFYSNKYVISNEENQILFMNFENNIKNIIANLRKDQLLIISTVMSNDLYPPLLDFQKVEDSKINTYNELASKIYDDLVNGKKISKESINLLPSGAHRLFLEGIDKCTNSKFDYKTSKIDSRCKKLLREARRLDGIPFRVPPEINEFVNSLKGKHQNVSVIDVESILNSSSNFSEYLSHFIDFAHPSPKGHTIIAKKVSEVLFPDQIVDYKFLNSCDKYQINVNNNKKIIEPDKSQILIKSQKNIGWLHRFIALSSTSMIHEHYLINARNKIKRCS